MLYTQTTVSHRCAAKSTRGALTELRQCRMQLAKRIDNYACGYSRPLSGLLTHTTSLAHPTPVGTKALPAAWQTEPVR